MMMEEKEQETTMRLFFFFFFFFQFQCRRAKNEKGTGPVQVGCAALSSLPLPLGEIQLAN